MPVLWKARNVFKGHGEPQGCSGCPKERSLLRVHTTAIHIDSPALSMGLVWRGPLAPEVVQTSVLEAHIIDIDRLFKLRIEFRAELLNGVDEPWRTKVVDRVIGRRTCQDNASRRAELN